jgi:glycosyltransferase involved in cell wall biosynthesis
LRKRTLVLGPGKLTRGGMTSVIKAHSQTTYWNEYNCKWIETYIDRGTFRKLWFFASGFMNFLVNLNSAEIVHIHFSDPSSARRKNLFLKLARLSGKKVILHLHSSSPELSLMGPRKELYQNMFNKADVIIALSGLWKTLIANLVSDPGKIHVLFNPCNSTEPLEHIEKQNFILFAGKLNQRKGYADLITAFGKIAHKYPDWKIVLAGNGEIDKGRELAEKLSIETQVVFKGWVSGKEKEELFSGASIFCLPSYSEGFPMSILDAWAYGLPVITTPVGGLPDVLEDGENGLVFEPGDIDSLASKIERLISDETLRSRLSEASLNLKNNQFNINNISDRLHDIYSQMSGKTVNCQ